MRQQGNGGDDVKEVQKIRKSTGGGGEADEEKGSGFKGAWNYAMGRLQTTQETNRTV